MPKKTSNNKVAQSTIWRKLGTTLLLVIGVCQHLTWLLGIVTGATFEYWILASGSSLRVRHMCAFAVDWLNSLVLGFRRAVRGSFTRGPDHFEVLSYVGQCQYLTWLLGIGFWAAMCILLPLTNSTLGYWNLGSICVPLPLIDSTLWYWL